MKLDLKRIAVIDGETIPFSYDADLTKEEMNGEYPFRTPVHIEGEVRNHLGVLNLHATVRALYQTQCGTRQCGSQCTVRHDLVRRGTG